MPRAKTAKQSKPGSRETQRKQQHSLIEKARRTKINQALATLRELVPTGTDDHVPNGTPHKKPAFKLEILVETVAFLQSLLDRVHTLEAAQSCSCHTPDMFLQPPDRRFQIASILNVDSSSDSDTSDPVSPSSSIRTAEDNLAATLLLQMGSRRCRTSTP